MADPKTIPPGRAVVLNAMLSVFISCVVFAVIALVVLVPQMARQEGEIRQLQATVVAMQNVLDEATKAPEVAAAPAGNPAAPGANAAPGTQAPVATAPATPAKPGK